MAKRGNNEGSIYKRADGRWAASLNLGWQNGRRKRKTFYAKTRREAGTIDCRSQSPPARLAGDQASRAGKKPVE